MPTTYQELCRKYEEARRELSAARAEIARLREALLDVSRQKQHGACWCTTAGNVYCVDQPKCTAARRALGKE